MTTYPEEELSNISSFNEQKRANMHLFASSINHSFKSDKLIETNMTPTGNGERGSSIQQNIVVDIENSYTDNNSEMDGSKLTMEGDLITTPLDSFTKHEVILQSPNNDHNKTFNYGNRISKITNLTTIDSQSTYVSNNALNSLNTIQSNDDNNNINSV